MVGQARAPRPEPARSRSPPARAACRSSATGPARRSGPSHSPAQPARPDLAHLCPGVGSDVPRLPIRSIATSSASGPPRAPRPRRAARRAADPGALASRDGRSRVRSPSRARRSSPRRSGPAPMRPSMMPSVNRRIAHCSGSSISNGSHGPSPRPIAGAVRPPARWRPSPLRSTAGTGMARADDLRTPPCRVDLESRTASRTARGRWRSCSNTRQQRVEDRLLRGAGQPASARHAARRPTPIAASSAPWPQTSTDHRVQPAVGLRRDRRSRRPAAPRAAAGTVAGGRPDARSATAGSARGRVPVARPRAPAPRPAAARARLPRSRGGRTA